MGDDANATMGPSCADGSLPVRTVYLNRENKVIRVMFSISMCEDQQYSSGSSGPMRRQLSCPRLRSREVLEAFRKNLRLRDSPRMVCASIQVEVSVVCLTVDVGEESIARRVVRRAVGIPMIDTLVGNSDLGRLSRTGANR